MIAPLLCVLGACQAAPPAAKFQGPWGLVRAANEDQAKEISGLFEGLRTRVSGILPDAQNRACEVWVQETPALYLFSGDAYSEADGFWSETHGRIHLREDAQSLGRTLAHELVHASLGPSWHTLPGTLEEGLCDVVSVMLWPQDAASMRTGRFSAAAFATGGLELEVQLFMPGEPSTTEIEIGSSTSVRLMANEPHVFDPRVIFDVEAGLSSTHIPINDKKALYGLSYLLMERIVARRGFIGLHRLCLRAEAQGLDKVPADWLLSAAKMGPGARDDWKMALREAIGPAELKTLVERYPDLVSNSATRFLGQQAKVEADPQGISPISASVHVRGSATLLDFRIDLTLTGIEARESPFRRE